MGNGAGPVVGIGKGFNAGAKERKLTPEIYGALPDDFSDVLGRSNVNNFFLQWWGGWRGEDGVFYGRGDGKREQNYDG